MTPPELRIGSTRQAARLPTDWASIMAKAKSSWRGQSNSPPGVTKSGRYAFGVGMAKFPGDAGPYPLRPELYVAAAAAWVIPCHECANETTSCPPVTSFAMRTAASFASAPVVRGDALLRADEQPVVLFYGELPSYRLLAPGATGADVKQLESNLHALGYTEFTVDAHFTASTSVVVKRWQRDLHRPATGTVAPDAVIYLPGPVRIASWAARPGDSATGEVLTCTGTKKVVTAQVSAQNASWATKGAAVDVVPPVGGPLHGKVADVGTELEAQSGGDDTSGGGSGGGAGPVSLTVTITIADQAALRGIDHAPVKVLHVLERRADVLTVTVTALVAPIEGGYAVEVVDGGHTRLAPVQTGLFADGRVEISGDGLDVGMKVRVSA